MNSNCCILVLGASLYPSSNGPLVPRMMQERCKEAARLYRDLSAAGQRPYIIVSGADTKNVGISEARVMKTMLIDEMHDRVVKVFLDEKSTNTIENISNNVEALESTDWAWVVTSDFHARRVGLLCRNMVKTKEVQVISSITKWQEPVFLNGDGRVADGGDELCFWTREQREELEGKLIV